MTSLQFEIPLPPKEGSPNSRCHWAKKAKAVKTYRQTAQVMAMQALKSQKPLWTKAEISYEFYCEKSPGTCAPRDVDNALACMKSAQDGFGDAGVFVSDSAKHVSVLAPVFHRTKKEHGGKSCVVVRIRSVTDGPD